MIRERISINPSDSAAWLEAMFEPSDTPRPAMLIIPGGGYAHVCYDREGWDIGDAFMKHGMNCFVLKYRVGPEYKYPEHLIDAALSMDYIRKNAAKYSIDPNRVYTVGFSAGGHLSGSMAILHKDPDVLSALGIEKGDNKPCGSILCYPVVSAKVATHQGSFAMLAGKPFSEITEAEADKLSLETHVDEDSAPVFIWHTSEDPGVPMLGSLRLTEAYYNIGRAVSLHVYPYGPHGIALANEETSDGNAAWIQPLAQSWVDESVRWIKTVKSY